MCLEQVILLIVAIFLTLKKIPAKLQNALKERKLTQKAKERDLYTATEIAVVHNYIFPSFLQYFIDHNWL